MNVLVRMRYSQALRLVPSWNWWKAANALTKVSWTRSSASAGFRVIRIAAAYSWSRYGSASRSNRARRSSTVSSATAFPLPSARLRFSAGEAEFTGPVAGSLRRRGPLLAGRVDDRTTGAVRPGRLVTAGTSIALPLLLSRREPGARPVRRVQHVGTAQAFPG